MERMSQQERRHRSFSESFKQEKVGMILRKEITVTQLSRVYDVTRAAVYKWIDKYSNLPKGERMVIEKESQESIQISLLHKISTLEQKVGQQQMEIDYYKQVISKASEEAGCDLEKKSGLK